MKINYENPENLGVDRVLSAFAAYKIYKDSCVIIDIGTAVTVDAVTGDGTFAGGFIFPGMELLSWSLTSKTDLPNMPPDGGGEGIGSGTKTCIAQGLHVGFTEAITGLIKKAAAFI